MYGQADNTTNSPKSLFPIVISSTILMIVSPIPWGKAIHCEEFTAEIRNPNEFDYARNAHTFIRTYIPQTCDEFCD